jgi:hypothetical protein
MTDLNLTTVLPELRRPFTAAAVNWKVQTSPKQRGNGWSKALAVGFMDARMCAERLNAVVGGNWSDSFGPRDGNSVVCRLTVLGATREDVGFAENVSSDMGMKGMYSDAFKRACVAFGLGAYLYAMPKMYLDASLLKQGPKSWYMTREAEQHLTQQYVRWLQLPATVKQFGTPRDHGDAEDSQGDVEAAPNPERDAKAAAVEAARADLQQVYVKAKPDDDVFGTVLDDAGVPAGDNIGARVMAATVEQLRAAKDATELLVGATPVAS